MNICHNNEDSIDIKDTYYDNNDGISNVKKIKKRVYLSILFLIVLIISVIIFVKMFSLFQKPLYNINNIETDNNHNLNNSSNIENKSDISNAKNYNANDAKSIAFETVDLLCKYKKEITNYRNNNDIKDVISLYKYKETVVFINNLLNTYVDKNTGITRYIFYCKEKNTNYNLVFDNYKNISGKIIIDGFHIDDKNITVNPGNYNITAPLLYCLNGEELLNNVINTEDKRNIEWEYATKFMYINDLIFNKYQIDRNKLSRSAIELYDDWNSKQNMFIYTYNQLKKMKEIIIYKNIGTKISRIYSACPDDISHRVKFENDFFTIFDQSDFSYGDDTGRIDSTIHEILRSIFGDI